MGGISESNPTGLYPSDGPIPQGGKYRQGMLFLSSPDFGITLTFRINFPVFDDMRPATYRIYYLSPLDIGDASILVDIGTAKLSKQFVTDLNADDVNIASVAYTPLGTEGTRRDYSLGGWMFAAPLLANGTIEGTSSNYARVPIFDRDTTPPDQQFGAVTLSTTGPVANIYTTTLVVTNPLIKFGRTKFVQVWMSNYFNDGALRCMGVYRLHGSPGDPNGQQFVYQLERDGGGHNVVFYAAYLNGQRSAVFAKVITTYQNATQVGGYP